MMRRIELDLDAEAFDVRRPIMKLAVLAFFLVACGHSPARNLDGGVANDGGGSMNATLSWDAPTMYTDGTPLTVAGYHVYYGTSSGVYGTPIDAKLVTSYVFNAPSPATYYFAVTAYDSAGGESMPSTEVSKSLQ
jgi:hypothetical protein